MNRGTFAAWRGYIIDDSILSASGYIPLCVLKWVASCICAFMCIIHKCTRPNYCKSWYSQARLQCCMWFCKGAQHVKRKQWTVPWSWTLGKYLLLLNIFQNISRVQFSDNSPTYRWCRSSFPSMNRFLWVIWLLFYWRILVVILHKHV